MEWWQVVIAVIVLAVVALLTVLDVKARQLKATVKRIPFWEMFRATGARYGIDPYLLAAMALVESSFQPEKINQGDPGGGSWGLMQVQVRTANDMKPGIDQATLLIPQVSIELAAMYLRWMSLNYGYSWPADIGAYNVGPFAYRQGTSRAAAARYRAKVEAALKEVRA